MNIVKTDIASIAAAENIKLIYGHDPLCGWCYAFISALRKFSASYPNVTIELAVGGLFSGDRVQPYSNMFDYITEAFGRVKLKTGRHGSEAFFNMIKAPGTGQIFSAPPNHALLQIQQIAPNKVIEFAHRLQEAHFEDGLSFNDAEIYDKIATELDLPALDIEALLAATDDDFLVRKGYRHTASLGIRSYPTCLVLDQHDRELGVIDSIYDPSNFVEAVTQLLNKQSLKLSNNALSI